MPENYNNTVYYLKKRGEICSATHCDKCPLADNNNGTGLACEQYEKKFPEKAIAAVREWHEKETKKFTYKDDFFNKFPRARQDTEGFPMDRATSKIIPACSIYPEILNKVVECSDCADCWNMEKKREEE